MSVLYPFTDPVIAAQTPPRMIVAGEGCWVTDADGNRFFDAVAGLWCSPLGFNPPRLAEAAKAQMDRLAYYHSFMGRSCAVTAALAARLTPHLPAPLAHVFFGTTGSDAVETAIKLMRYAQIARGKPDKMRVIAREGAYHGSGHISAALTAMPYCHEGFLLPAEAVLRTGRPHVLRDAEPGETERDFSRRRGRELDRLIRAADPGTIGAFIGEPAMGAGGVILPPEGYWAEIQEVLARHDILLIADEIITGFGRTGRWFGCETFGIRPDMMTMAKQLTAAVFPLSAVALSDDLHESIASQAHGFGILGHGFTYGGHPVGAAIALETLAIYEEMDLPAHIAALGADLEAALSPLGAMPGVAQIRRAGLLAAVEMRADTPHGAEIGRRVTLEAEARGVFFRAIGPVVAVSPPYIATPGDIAMLGRVMAASIDAALA
ncbi:MAG: aminotransferase class III-fold pyridoxal phosphate-dependent enzyme [Pseudomonadota bacterium]